MWQDTELEEVERITERENKKTAVKREKTKYRDTRK